MTIPNANAPAPTHVIERTFDASTLGARSVWASPLAATRRTNVARKKSARAGAPAKPSPAKARPAAPASCASTVVPSARRSVTYGWRLRGLAGLLARVSTATLVTRSPLHPRPDPRAATPAVQLGSER